VPKAPQTLRRQLCAALLLSTAAAYGIAAEPAWLESARTSCAADYNDDRCADQSFLQQEYAPDTIAATREVARKAGVRRNRAESRAMREVLLQHTGLCDQKPAQFCPPGNPAACQEQLRQTCAVIKQRAAACETQAAQYCAKQRNVSQCLDVMQKQCGGRNQSLDQILAKYPDLSPSQKSRIHQVAVQLEENEDKSMLRALAGNLLKVLGFAAAL
jgi:hypothetical protein